MNETEDERKIANARVGYQVAASLWTYEGGLIWSKFNALLVAHTILLAGIGLSMTASNGKGGPFLGKAMLLAGVALCILWFFLIKRGFDNYDYWVKSARELEERYLAPVETVSRGGKFADGGEVSFNIGKAKETFVMPRVSRILRAEYSSYGIVAVFFVLYVILGLKAWGCF